VTDTRQKQGGFTLIEIMAAMIVFMISVLGLIAMQKASIGAAEKARQQTAANNIARFVTTQIKTEFANWKENTLAPASSQAFPLVSAAIAADALGNDSVDSWVQLGGDVGTALRLDDFLGHSALTDNDGASRFCVNYKLTPLAPTLPRNAQTVWRVRVRVTWTRSGGDFFQPIGGTAWNVCTPVAIQARIDQSADDVVELVTMASREFAR
jgi:Tfp pilus assembly protein PilV